LKYPQANRLMGRPLDYFLFYGLARLGIKFL
jgi:hypothetical protein